ncbi:hypothetical protein TREES_T100002571 [Tupaia chinensis]|uniref:Uncharacterized protein n=1 Tax=Tupaia chinensis TaxID=246437 RepID=L9L5U4_TUPCH|nr:hypothetical protein TREES_T100002571 [Tupaia chinensis]
MLVLQTRCCAWHMAYEQGPESVPVTSDMEETRVFDGRSCLTLGTGGADMAPQPTRDGPERRGGSLLRWGGRVASRCLCTGPWTAGCRHARPCSASTEQVYVGVEERSGGDALRKALSSVSPDLEGRQPAQIGTRTGCPLSASAGTES